VDCRQPTSAATGAAIQGRVSTAQGAYRCWHASVGPPQAQKRLRRARPVPLGSMLPYAVAYKPRSVIGIRQKEGTANGYGRSG